VYGEIRHKLRNFSLFREHTLLSITETLQGLNGCIIDSMFSQHSHLAAVTHSLSHKFLVSHFLPTFSLHPLHSPHHSQPHYALIFFFSVIISLRFLAIIKVILIELALLMKQTTRSLRKFLGRQVPHIQSRAGHNLGLSNQHTLHLGISPNLLSLN